MYMCIYMCVWGVMLELAVFYDWYIILPVFNVWKFSGVFGDLQQPSIFLYYTHTRIYIFKGDYKYIKTNTNILNASLVSDFSFNILKSILVSSIFRDCMMYNVHVLFFWSYK